MSETLRTIVTHFSNEILIIVGSFSIIVFTLLLIFWSYNRKKFQTLGHQIPATVVKNYLDSIIQNSMALKSSLFRGNGLDLGEGIPSVFPLSHLGGGDNVSAASAQELGQKNAEIAALKAQLSEKRAIIAELEAKIAELSAGDSKIPALQAEIKNLKSEGEQLRTQLKDASQGGKSDPAVASELTAVKKERDSLFERLQEYEIIEDDLANLKKLQQENEQLKRALENAKLTGSVAMSEAPIPAPSAPEPTPAPAAAVAPPTAVEPVAAAAISAEENPPIKGEEKSAEDLLSEFEKMLG